MCWNRKYLIDLKMWVLNTLPEKVIFSILLKILLRLTNSVSRDLVCFRLFPLNYADWNYICVHLKKRKNHQSVCQRWNITFLNIFHSDNYMIGYILRISKVCYLSLYVTSILCDIRRRRCLLLTSLSAVGCTYGSI